MEIQGAHALFHPRTKSRLPFLSYALLTFCLVSLPSSKLWSNVVGSDGQNFNTITSGVDFITVHSSETLAPGLFNLGAFLNYAVNTLPYFDNTPQGRTHFNDSLLGLDLNVGLGLTNNWDVGMSLPFVVSQSVNANNSYRGQFSNNGNTEVRFNTKYRILGDDSQGLGIVGSVNFDRVIDNPYSGVDAGPTYNLELAGDTTFRKIALGLNLGHRWRTPGRGVANSPIQPLTNQFIASMAVSYLFTGYDTKLISEIFTSFPSQSKNSDLDRSLTTGEWIVGLKHDFTHHLAMHIGAGTEIMHGVSSPDWRVYTGLNYSFGPVWGRDSEEPNPSLTIKTARVVKPSLEPVEGNEERFRTRNIYFEFDSDKMIGTYQGALAELAAHIQKTGQYKELIIEGHTDSVGANIYNQDLSQRRARAIRSYMIVVHKLEGNKIVGKGYGEILPIADNGNYQGRQLNRRVEFRILR